MKQSEKQQKFAAALPLLMLFVRMKGFEDHAGGEGVTLVRIPKRVLEHSP